MNSRIQRPSTAKKNTLPPQTEDIEEYMQTLYDHQKTCERAGKYLEADQAKKRLVELRQELEQKTKFDIRDRHHYEKNELEKAHQDEMRSFNQFWDSKIQEFEEEAMKLKHSLAQRHQDEMNEFIQDLEQSIPQAPKDSGELLSLRRSEEQLAKQESYLEAHQIQQRILSLQKDEFEKWSIQRNSKIRNIIQSLKQKQTNEQNALMLRISNAQDEQRKMRFNEEEKMIQKFLNVKKDLESQQLQELSKLEKNIKNQSFITFSKQSKMSQSMQQEEQFTQQGK